MKTKLLKKLRKEAYKKIGLIYKYNVYSVVWRKDSYYDDYTGKNIKISSFDFKEAEKFLTRSRRIYILWKISQLKIKKLNKKINKL